MITLREYEEMSDEELMEEYRMLSGMIDVAQCFSSKDVMRRQIAHVNLEHRGYRILIYPEIEFQPLTYDLD